MSERFTRWSDFPMEVRPMPHHSDGLRIRQLKKEARLSTREAEFAVAPPPESNSAAAAPESNSAAATAAPESNSAAAAPRLSWIDMLEAEAETNGTFRPPSYYYDASAAAATPSNAGGGSSSIPVSGADGNAAASASESAETVTQPRLIARAHEEIRRNYEDNTERVLLERARELQRNLRGCQHELQDHRERVRMRRREFEVKFASSFASTTCKGTVTDPALITNECPITFEPLTCETAFHLPCGHSCDRASLLTWWETNPDKRNKCPLRCEKMNTCPCSSCSPAKPPCSSCGRYH